jgi:Amt family ammonium transporter
MTQLAGVLACGAFVFIASFITWKLIKATIGLRVSLQEEIDGLDIGEHGNSAYPEFLTRKPAYSFSGLNEEKS